VSFETTLKPEKLRIEVKAKKRATRPPKFSHYTPLNVNKGRISEEALNVDLIPSLQKLPTPQNANTSNHWHLSTQREE